MEPKGFMMLLFIVAKIRHNLNPNSDEKVGYGTFSQWDI